jgi:hypothetical protein
MTPGRSRAVAMIVAALFCMALFLKELGIDCGMDLGAAAARAESPAALAELPAVPLSEPGGEPLLRPPVPPRNTGPAARSHSRYRRGRHGTTRIIRRTPDVMREDAARVKRGDLFSTWSNEFLE